MLDVDASLDEEVVSSDAASPLPQPASTRTATTNPTRFTVIPTQNRVCHCPWRRCSDASADPRQPIEVGRPYTWPRKHSASTAIGPSWVDSMLTRFASRTIHN